MKKYKPILKNLELPEYEFKKTYKGIPKNLVYGNPSSTYKKILNLKKPLFNWREFLKIMTPPDNDNSNIVKQEIEYLKKLNRKLTKKEINVIKFLDSSDENIFINFLKSNGVDEDKKMFNLINNELAYLIVKLKLHFQRPRPYQLAYHYNIKLHPLESISAWTPSYPSGHGFQGIFYARYYAWKYPHLKKELMRFGKEFADSRIYGGYHYPSDNLVSKKISDYFFKKKYHLTLEKKIKEKYY